jgi:hypothetical protein
MLKATNQLWKIYVFVVSMALGAGVTLFQSLLYRVLEKEAITTLVIGGMVLVIGVFVWTYASITCPNCNLKLFRYSILKVGLGTWFTWLVNLEKCPECGSRDGLPAPVNKRVRSKTKSLK